MKKVELLAPVGDKECFKAAIENGADAIYLGAKNFGARNNAAFNDNDIQEMIKTAHLRGVKVYVTMNTLVYDDELEQALEVVDFLYRNQCDALLIQDLGLLYLVRKMYPDFEVHASTQLNTHSVEQAKVLKDLGVKRVVLSRETGINICKKIKEQLNMEVEVFVHGALCMSYSGQCLMSSFIGKRSGNRGACAQPCRLPYTLYKEDEKITSTQYLLSTKDLNTIEYINNILEAGADSLKIEGRLKNPEYVAEIVRMYRKAIDTYYAKKSFTLTNIEKNEMAQVFNRDFTKGFLNYERPFNITNPERSNNKGVFIGKIINVDKYKFYIKPTCSLINGDGIRIVGKEEQGFNIGRMFINNKYVTETKANDLVGFPYTKKPSIGDLVFKTYDKRLNEKLKNTYNTIYRKVPITFHILAKIGKNLEIEIEDDLKNKCHYTSEYIVTKGLKAQTNKERIKEQLGKLNNSFYFLKEVTFDIDENIIIPISFLNQIRRELVELLNEKRANPYERKGKQPLINEPLKITKTEFTMKAKVRNEKQEKAASSYFDFIYSYKDEKRGKTFSPRIKDFNQEINSNILLINELSDLQYHKYLIADTYMNVTNIFSMYLLYSLGVKCVTLSLEMNKDRIKNIIENFEKTFNTSPNVEVIVYGRNDLMITKHCPINAGLNINKENCRQCQMHQFYLKDRMGAMLPLQKDSMCNMQILNSKRIHLLKYLDELKDFGVNNLRLDFTIEDEEEVLSISKAYKENNQYYSLDDFTYGYYNE